MIFLINEVIQSLEKDPMVLKMITKHLGWGMFKNSLVEPIDDTQRNIHDVYMDLMKQSEYEYREPEMMIYLIIEMTAGCCYNSILMEQPVQRNIHDVYMDLMKQSEYEYREPEMMIYLIIEMTAGCCYNSILMEQPVPMGELRPYLYDAVRLIIQNHQIKK